MTNEDIFDRWCPPAGRWSVWAKPVLFTQLLPLEKTDSLRGEWECLDFPWAREDPSATGVVIDLPGTESLLIALALAGAGYQPVSLFNCCAAEAHEVLPTGQIREYLVRGAGDLSGLALPPGAPPAFLLDSDRLAGKAIPHPGLFDNRWLTFPQDFPSGIFLKEAGLRRVVLLQRSQGQPSHDLAHVLLRWQEAGLSLAVADPSGTPPQALMVLPPPRYRWFFQRALALLGFRRNSAGGFGSVIPELTGAG